MTIMKSLELIAKNANNQNNRIPCENHENQKNIRITRQDHENHENFRIPYENCVIY